MVWEEKKYTRRKKNKMQTQEPNQNDTTNETEKPSAKSVCCGIYGLRNKTNGKWYVGQSLDIYSRWDEYKVLRCKSQRKLFNALKKYGFEGFECKVLELCEATHLNPKEDCWMDCYDSIEDGYNIRQAGSRGKQSEETKRLMSMSAIGKIKTADHISKLPQNQRGYKQSPELVKKRADSLRGKKRSKEVCQKISDGRKKILPPKMTHEQVKARRRELYHLKKLQ